MTHFITQTHQINPNIPTSVVFLMIHDKMLIAFGDESFMFLTYQLSMVGYWPTMAVTGPIESVFESGEGALETATTSKEGSRRSNYPILNECVSCKSQWNVGLLELSADEAPKPRSRPL